jgi:hypothetical protein
MWQWQEAADDGWHEGDAEQKIVQHTSVAGDKKFEEWEGIQFFIFSYLSVLIPYTKTKRETKLTVLREN